LNAACGVVPDGDTFSDLLKTAFDRRVFPVDSGARKNGTHTDMHR
jgi:hypothetical protein